MSASKENSPHPEHASAAPVRQGGGLPALALAVGIANSAASAWAWSATQELPDATTRTLLRAAIERADTFVDRFDAEVWLLDMSGRLERAIGNSRERLEILRHVHREASRAQLEPELVLALIQVESNFDRFAISHAGARGLMQVMPFWLEEIGREDDNLFHIETNLRFGCTILRLYLDREQGNMERALARYNGSLGKRWYPDRVFRALRTRWFRQ